MWDTLPSAMQLACKSRNIKQPSWVSISFPVLALFVFVCSPDAKNEQDQVAERDGQKANYAIKLGVSSIQMPRG
ncbi:hypothetical protein L209DRAFT_757490 [Thermothelomyces heterothallicus CBS 203.75]